MIPEFLVFSSLYVKPSTTEHKARCFVGLFKILLSFFCEYCTYTDTSVLPPAFYPSKSVNRKLMDNKETKCEPVD